MAKPVTLSLLMILHAAFNNSLPADELSLADLIEQAEPACVRIDVSYKDGSKGIGSGFVVDAQRKWVVTNYHVVGDSKTATVTFADKTKAAVLGWNAHYTTYDLALLKIETDKKLTALPVAIVLPRKGDKTIAIGAPQGLSFTASEGIVSGIREGTELKQFGTKLTGTWLQTSTPISPGSSGGPLLNFEGEVVGVNSSSLEGAQNLNFAISCEQINRLVNVGKRIRLRKLEQLTPVKEAGGVPRAASPKEIVIQIPSKRRFRHRYDIEVDEDEFDQITWLRTEWLKVKHENRKLSSLGVRITLAHDDDKTALIAIWEVGSTVRVPEFNSPAKRRLQLAGGGESYELPVPQHEGKQNGRGVSEVMTSITGLDVLAEVVLTQDLKARLGTTEMEFGRNELECLRELMSKVPTGDLVEGKIRIERLKPEKDPTSPLFGKKTVAANTQSLFNGKDLTGWHLDVSGGITNSDNQQTFIVRDEKIVALRSQRGFLISDKQYENYRIEFEYRFPGKAGGSGLAVHVTKLRALLKKYPQSIEVQMNSGSAGDFWLCGEDITVPNMAERRGPKELWGIWEGKSRWILNLTDDSEKPPGEWNTMTVECVGDEIKVWVNGDLVNHGSKCTASKGQIALQAEGAEVEFRDLHLTPIEKLSE